MLLYTNVGLVCATTSQNVFMEYKHTVVKHTESKCSKREVYIKPALLAKKQTRKLNPTNVFIFSFAFWESHRGKQVIKSIHVFKFI